MKGVLSWFGSSLYRKMVTGLLLGLLPVAVFAYVVIQGNADQARLRATAGARQTAAIAAAAVQDFVSATQNEAHLIAEIPGIASLPGSALHRLLQRLVADTNLDDVLVVGPRGRLRASGWLLNRPPTPQEAGELTLLASLNQPRVIHINHWFEGRQRPILFVQPLDATRAEGVVIAVVTAWRLYHVLSASAGESPAEVYLTDHRGFVISHPYWMYANHSVNLSGDPPVSAALEGSSGVVRFTYQQRQRMAAYSPVSGVGWAVVVSYPSDFVFPAPRQVVWHGLGLLALVVTLALALLLIIARQVVKPTEALTRGVEAIAAGDYSQRVAESLRGEVGRLGRAFNRMAVGLQRTTQELHDAEVDLRNKAEQLQRLWLKSEEVREEERRRIACDLHDGMLQDIVGTLGGVQACRQALVRDSGPAAGVVEKLHFIEQLLKEVVDDTRRTIFNLRPQRLETGGLVPAVELEAQEFSRLYGTPCRVGVHGGCRRLDPTIELALYRVVQEALQNVAKHSGAREVQLSVHFRPDRVHLIIRDDGRGLPVDPGQASLGLLSMRERVEAIGGTFTLRSGRGRGTRIAVDVRDRGDGAA